ncbi:MAG: hypothetical protein GC158_02040 [Cyanobacteria bacterium RI_101]|nr:hypothetical protein [Cyanobacteria bacterium RI_101]
MSHPTHAHLTFTLAKNLTLAYKEQTKRQKEYYMGAKLLEIGVEPKSAVYRWSLKTNPAEEIWTYSAFWGESKEQLLSGSYPLKDAELLDCARANAAQGLQTAAQLCGYGEDTGAFETALGEAAREAGLHLSSLGDLLPKTPGGVQVAPESISSL